MAFAFVVGFKYPASCGRKFSSASKHVSHLCCFSEEQVRNLCSVYVVFNLGDRRDQ